MFAKPPSEKQCGCHGSDVTVGLMACREGGVQIRKIYLPFRKVIYV
jgi:hypothetical protein